MKITDILKMEGGVNARLSLVDAWLVWDEDRESWIVYWKQYRQPARQYGATIDEEVACRMLLEAAGIDVDAGSDMQGDEL